MDSNQAANTRTAPRQVSITVGILVAAAITLLGWGSRNVWWHLADVAAGILVAGAAVLVVRNARRRGDVPGPRGSATQEATSVLIGAIALFVVGLTTTAQLRAVYAGLGAAAGVAIAVLLYRRDYC